MSQFNQNSLTIQMLNVNYITLLTFCNFRIIYLQLAVRLLHFLVFFGKEFHRGHSPKKERRRESAGSDNQTRRQVACKKRGFRKRCHEEEQEKVADSLSRPIPVPPSGAGFLRPLLPRRQVLNLFRRKLIYIQTHCIQLQTRNLVINFSRQGYDLVWQLPFVLYQVLTSERLAAET